MDHFTVTQPLAGVYHIRDAADVCFTLVIGERDSLLFDTGVGLYDVTECIAPYVRGKLRVVLSHAHYDHTFGQHYFGESFVHPVDLRSCRRCVGRRFRQAQLDRIKKRGILKDDFDSERFLNGTPETVKPLSELSLDLGNLTVQFLHTPGHTAGSIVAYIPEHKLLLTGDMWNPQTWLFFPECQPLSAYTRSMKGLHDLPAQHVLCSHDIAPRTMQRLRAYIAGLNEETFAAAEPCTVAPYTQIHTFCCHPGPDSTLIFNGDKRK